MTSMRSSGRVVWAVTSATVVAVVLATAFGPLADVRWEHPDLLFSLATVGSLVCVIAATTLIAVADRRSMAEVGLLGSLLMGASVMSMVHGLLTPDVLFDENAGFAVSSLLTLPVAVAVGAPLFVPGSALGRRIARHWRDWTLLALLGVFAIASLIVFLPNVLEGPSASNGAAILASVALLVAFVALSGRQLRLYELGGGPAHLVASCCLGLIAVAALAPIAPTRYSPGFWLLHVIGGVGVLGACAALGVMGRMSPTAQELLAPVLARDPLLAFELGLSPVVRTFVADLEDEDEVTRSHVIRTGELAMRVGERFRLSGAELRDLGLAAALHDVGKVHVPDEIVTKPGALTRDEYEMMKRHPVHGEAMLRAEPLLVPAAAIVRSHHERFDGGGYPDGLTGRDIPLASRIIAACDALDAMTHERRYRTAMSMSIAFAIMREHAGTQWDAEVVAQVIAARTTMPEGDAYGTVGRPADHDDTVRVPDDIGQLLATVDAEI